HPAGVGHIADRLGKRRTRHAVRDLLDVEQVRPRRIHRCTQLEPCGDDQRTYLSRKKWPAPRGSRPRAPVRASLRQEAVIGVPGSTRWIQVSPAGRCITLPSEPRIFSGSSALVRSQVAVQRSPSANTSAGPVPCTPTPTAGAPTTSVKPA